MKLTKKIIIKEHTPLELGSMIDVRFGFDWRNVKVLSHLDGTVLKFGTCDYKPFNERVMDVPVGIECVNGILGTVSTKEVDEEFELVPGSEFYINTKTEVVKLVVVYEGTDEDGNDFLYAVDVITDDIYFVEHTGKVYVNEYRWIKEPVGTTQQMHSLGTTQQMHSLKAQVQVTE